jgi:hypothetical protein
MIYFSVPNNINIKLIDTSLVEYKRFINDGLWINENIYGTTYDDFKDIKKIFSNVQQEDFKFNIISEERFNKSTLFPKKLGIGFKDEYATVQYYEALIEKQNFVQDHLKNKALDGYLEEELIAFDSIDFLQNEIRLVVIGYCSANLGEIINFCTALRILYHKLKEKCHKVSLDIYLQASSNTYYKRDKEILQSYSFIHKVMPLSITIQELCNYDYYIDMSSCEKSIYYGELPYVDFFLRQFGVDYLRVDDALKYNELNLNGYHINPKLEEKLKEIKQKGNLLLFHPFSAFSSRSVPVENSKKLLDKLINFSSQYVIVTALKIDNIKNENFIDLSLYSKTFFDFVYIISQMQSVITVDTSTYHISDAFFIPTVVLFNDESLIEKRLKYYQYVKPVKIENHAKSYSKFIFKNDALYVDDFQSWNKIDLREVIKLLEKIG